MKRVVFGILFGALMALATWLTFNRVPGVYDFLFRASGDSVAAFHQRDPGHDVVIVGINRQAKGKLGVEGNLEWRKHYAAFQQTEKGQKIYEQIPDQISISFNYYGNEEAIPTVRIDHALEGNPKHCPLGFF